MKELTFEQGTLDWHNARAGIVTGTTLSKAISTRKNDLLATLVSERMTEPDIVEINSDAVKRGNELEPIALQEYIKLTGVKFETTGMMMSEIISGFGVSPDAVYRESGVIVGGLEIKCPASKTHIQYCLDGVVPKAYWHQVLAPFVASDDVQWWDFMSFDDRNYEIPVFSIRTHRSEVEAEVQETRIKLKAFINEVESSHEKLTF